MGLDDPHGFFLFFLPLSVRVFSIVLCVGMLLIVEMFQGPFIFMLRFGYLEQGRCELVRYAPGDVCSSMSKLDFTLLSLESIGNSLTNISLVQELMDGSKTDDVFVMKNGWNHMKSP
jgi:hypothetical protein